VKTPKTLGRPPRTKASANGDTTREQLLAVAEKVFAEHGFAGASFRTLGNAAGLSNAAILYYFASKKKLYAAVLARVEDSFRTGLASLDFSGNPLERVRRIVDYQLAWGRTHPTYVQIMMRDLVENRDRIPFARKMAMEESMSIIRRAYLDLNAAGRFGDIDPTMLQYMISGAIIYFQVALPTLSRLLDSSDWIGLERNFATTIHGVLQCCLGEDRRGRKIKKK
jgi:TetR/AcrR family transcriptional regulator